VFRRLVIIAAIGVIALWAVFAGVMYVALQRTPDTHKDPPVRFTVDQGEAFSAITKRLAREGLLRYPRALSVYAWLTRKDKRIHAGTYELSGEEKPVAIVHKLTTGDVLKIPVTVPEGFMHRQIAGVVASTVGADSAAFSALFDDGDFLLELSVDGPSLEGYLFPDTYLLPWGMPPRAVTKVMLARLHTVFGDSLQARARELGLSRHEVITFASIVEAETRVQEELPLVSAVYHNRLRRGMRLEADPTVAYAMGGYKGRLLFKDLETDSPYNTYLHRGLPPGPICSPGEGAIRAVLYPDSTCTALYFVAEGNGRHIFSRTLEEHTAAIRRVRENKNRTGGMRR